VREYDGYLAGLLDAGSDEDAAVKRCVDRMLQDYELHEEATPYETGDEMRVDRFEDELAVVDDESDLLQHPDLLEEAYDRVMRWYEEG
jgi:hypothetical protein